MTHREQMIAFVTSLALITAALTWLLGAYGLLGPGIVILLLALFVDERTDND